MLTNPPSTAIRYPRDDSMPTQNDRDSQLQQSIAIIRAKFPSMPKVAIILGSGLGALADEIETPIAFEYAGLPGFAKSTAGGHRGQLICGTLDGVAVVAMAGRFHRYEGYRDDEVTFPVRLMAALGAKVMVVSNAAGGVSPELNVGDIVVIRDHIDLAKTVSPLLMLGAPLSPASHHGEGSLNATNGEDNGLHDRLRIAGGRSLYDPELINVAMSAARSSNFHAQLGVYLATSGPTYETRAEYRMMRIFGADVVGMSTAPEVRVASLLGMRVLAVSMVSNVARPDAPEPADHEEVLAAGQAAAFKLRCIIRETLRISLYLAGPEPLH